LKGTNQGSKFAPYAPPSKVEQEEMANRLGAADGFVLEGLAQHADYQADIGEWHYGHLTAKRLRLLAEQLEKEQTIGSEERAGLHRTIADLAQQVDEATESGEDIDLTIRFELVNNGSQPVSLSGFFTLLAATEGKEDTTDGG
jgi:hypothetical protein